ncbi:MAG: restriction endonuclease [Armatimonadetes bacterium]|nr:restriction endonuclease [Armatimonadota bacterium]
MPVQLPPDLDAKVRTAVKHFWATRTAQARKQQRGRKVDQGARSAVTGGAQMDGFLDLFAELALGAGARPRDIRRGTRAVLPGLFRPATQWDLLINRGSQVVCAYKFACQTGPSSAKALAKITEEAIASAHDLWGAYRRSAINFDIQPWLGFVLVAQDAQPCSTVRSAEDFCRRLVLERLYSDASLLLAAKDGSYIEPAADLSLTHLCRILVARVAIHAAA